MFAILTPVLRLKIQSFGAAPFKNPTTASALRALQAFFSPPMSPSQFKFVSFTETIA